jgi:hypothetical protein
MPCCFAIVILYLTGLLPPHYPQKNFGRPVEWALVKDYPWSVPQLRKLEQPVDVHGEPWVAK